MAAESGDQWVSPSDWGTARRPTTSLRGPDAGQGEHLRAFTSTAQVPAVGWYPGQHPSSAPTGTVPVYQPPVVEPVNLLLRLSVWLVGFLVLVGLAGVAIHKVRPQWLRGFTVGATSPTTVAGETPTTAGNGSTQTTARSGQQKAGPVTVTTQSPTAATVTVDATSYTVQVVTSAPCWVEVTGGSSSAATFAATLPPKTTKQFNAQNGTLTLNGGASGVVITVLENGKAVKGWQYTPTAAPFTLHFVSR